ncbi:Sec23-binding domain of Sec16-domain-containing protein [Daedaleopsis nitida]|nr:Sec23-binding domain of Sec16-domain-containing protein [Daedaleopsis nitida]
MSTAGEAASLFGAPDTAQDPFSAALGGENPPDDLHTDEQTTHAVSDLFGSAADPFPVDGAGPSSVSEQDTQQTWYDPAGQQSYAYDNHATAGHSQAYQPATTYTQQNGSYASYGQHDQYAQSNTYSQPAPSTTSAYEPAYVQQQSYAPKTYTPYSQSTSTYASATTAQQAPITQNGTYAPSTYDPYKPTQTQSSYEPGYNAVNASAPAPSSYNPYKPAYTAAAPVQTYTYGTDSHTSAYGTPPVAVPPPPVPLASAAALPSPAISVTQYRPKTLNAYDPPIPPPKAKHVVPPRAILFGTSIQGAEEDSRPTCNAAASQGQPPVYNIRTPQLPHSSPYVRPTVNGTSHASAYQHSYNPPTNNASVPPYGGMQSGAHHLPEGLPKVNDTYAPPHHNYIPGLPQQSRSRLPESPATPAYEPAEIEHASPVSDIPAERTTSPLHETIPEVDEDISAVFGSGEEESIPAVSSSPPTSAAVSLDESAWPNHAQYRPPLPSQAPYSAYDPYAPAKSDASDRAKSPGASSIRSVASIQKNAYDPPLRRDSAATSVSRPLSSQSRRSTLSNSYEPHSVTDLKRAASPASSIRSATASKSAYDPYAPNDKSAAVSAASVHARTTSNGSTYSTTSVADPYSPARLPARTSSEHAYGSFALPATTYAPPANAYAPPAPTYDKTGAQVITLAAPAHSTYAPSPSLLGTNDPLGRAAARVPVVSFGFGGKLVTCFHGANMHTSFDVALSARQSTDVTIQTLHAVIPESALDSSATSYPGPLYSDPGSPTASLVRTGAQALKAKKAKVVKYLEDRAEEMATGLGYHRVGTVERSRAEAKRILVSLLKVMVENDGRLSGSVQIDAAVRAALVPKEGVSSADSSTGASAMIPAMSTELLSSNYSLSSTLQNIQDQTVSKTTVRSSQLDKIQELLAQGDRRGACHYAADEKLWQHALLIASSIDKECWKEVVTEWIRAELVTNDSQAQGDVTNGRESLRVAYSLLGGNGASAVQELVHPKSLLQHGPNNLQIPQPQLSVTPMTPSFPVIQPLNVSQEVLASWATTAAMILSNPSTPESSSALSALGDQLAVHQWTEAAHACYLLSPQTSPLGGIGSIPKLILLGSPPPNSSPMYYKDPDPLIFSEILEFAMSLATPAKGQEPFAGLQHLQPYRLLRAARLAELGYVQLATRYCEAITACVTRTSPYLNITLGEQLKGLTDRLVAAPQLDKSGSWIGGKMAKPSLDSIGNWLEGRFTKFIAGEGDSPRPEESKGMEHQQSYSGPFANYSSISSATTSTYPSPHHSVTDLTDVPPAAAPPFRTGSAFGNRPPSRQINRASSAMDHVRPFQRTGSPIARVASANAATFADAASYGQARANGAYGNGYTPAQGLNHLDSHGDVSGQHSKPPTTGSWGWGASESEVATPTASTFVSLDDQPSSGTSNSGFISLMDDVSTPTASKLMNTTTPRASQQAFDEDDEEDLGFGNKNLKRKTDKPENGHAASETAAKEEEKPEHQAAEADKPELKQTASGGWLSRIWGRSQNNTPAPVRANLGEQSSFYYDKELKRWVNKTVGAEAAKPSPPPPPPRAQTASPGRHLAGLQPPPSPLAPPPRPATAQPIDMTSEPPRRPPTRIRSNLVPSDAEGIATPPSPLPSSATPPPGSGPPAGRARGGAAKRNVRSRYVDVFSQENGGAS